MKVISEKVRFYMDCKAQVAEINKNHETKSGNINYGFAGQELERKHTGSVSPIGARDYGKFHGVEFKTGTGAFTGFTAETEELEDCRLTKCRYIAYAVTAVNEPHVFTERAFRELLIQMKLLRWHHGVPTIQSYLPTAKFNGLANALPFIEAVEAAPTWDEWLAARE